jgi:hypothetical protein
VLAFLLFCNHFCVVTRRLSVIFCPIPPKMGAVHSRGQEQKCKKMRGKARRDKQKAAAK